MKLPEQEKTNVDKATQTPLPPRWLPRERAQGRPPAAPQPILAILRGSPEVAAETGVSCVPGLAALLVPPCICA